MITSKSQTESTCLRTSLMFPSNPSDMLGRSSSAQTVVEMENSVKDVRRSQVPPVCIAQGESRKDL